MRKIIILISVLLPLAVPANAQKIDSLMAIYANSQGAERCKVLLELSFDLMGIDNAKVKQFSLEGLILSRQLNDSLSAVRIGKILSWVLRRQGDLDSAILICNQILPVAIELNELDHAVQIQNILVTGFLEKGRYAESLQNNFEALERANDVNDTAVTAALLGNIGLNYYKLKDYDKSFQYFKDAYVLKKKVHQPVSDVLVNIALCYAHKNDFIAAQSNLDTALKSCEPKCSNATLVNLSFCQGVIWYGMGKVELAISEFKRSLDLAGKEDRFRFQLDNLDHLSKIYLENGDIKNAVQYLKKAEGIVQSRTEYDLEAIKIYSNFIDLYKRTNDIENINLYQSLYIETKDRIQNENNTINLMRVEADHTEREYLARSEAQAKILDLKEQVIRTQLLVSVLIAAISVVLVVITALLWRSNRQKQMLNYLLDKKVKERTNELETNRDALKDTIREQKIFIQHISSELVNSIATINGLCSLGLQDTQDETAKSYIQKVRDASEGLRKPIENLKGIAH